MRTSIGRQLGKRLRLPRLNYTPPHTRYQQNEGLEVARARLRRYATDSRAGGRSIQCALVVGVVVFWLVTWAADLWMQDYMERGECELRNIVGDGNATVMLTKPVSRNK